MSNLLRAQLPSDDEEDDDYDPTSDKTAEKGDHLGKPAQNAQTKRKRGIVRGAIGAAVAEEGDSEEEERPNDLLAIAKKRKAEAAWAALQKPTSGAARKPVVPVNVSIASLCKPSAKPAKKKSDELWMQQLGLAKKKDNTADASKAVQDAAAKALAMAKEGVAAAGQQGKVTVTETRRFAGQNITVNKLVDAGSAQAQQAAEPPAPKSGLDAVLQSLETAKKVNVLDKSRHDWSDFKREHTEVDEELEGYKKSNDKYLDKVDFLQRAELREYEKERDKRLASDIRTRGRT